MARHNSFTDAEWALLGDAPLAAGAAVAMASPGGGRREANAMIIGWREAGEPSLVPLATGGGRRVSN